MTNIKSYLSYLSNTFTSPSVQKCHLATKAEAIDSFGKVGGRKARPNANFQLFETQKREAMDAGVYFLCSLELQILNKLEHMQGRKSPVNSL